MLLRVLFLELVSLAYTARAFFRRSSSLRTYAGDTSLPGGKFESGDKDLEDTAVCLVQIVWCAFDIIFARDEKHLKR